MSTSALDLSPANVASNQGRRRHSVLAVAAWMLAAAPGFEGVKLEDMVARHYGALELGKAHRLGSNLPKSSSDLVW